MKFIYVPYGPNTHNVSMALYKQIFLGSRILTDITYAVRYGSFHIKLQALEQFRFQIFRLRLLICTLASVQRSFLFHSM